MSASRGFAWAHHFFLWSFLVAQEHMQTFAYAQEIEMVGKLCNKLTMAHLSKAVQEDRAKEEMAKDRTRSP